MNNIPLTVYYKQYNGKVNSVRTKDIEACVLFIGIKWGYFRNRDINFIIKLGSYEINNEFNFN